MNPLIESGYRVDSVTNFLESDDHSKLQPKHKSAFLKAFKKSGDMTACIEYLNFTTKELLLHLQYDEAFKEAFQQTKLAMKHRLEGMLFTKGLQEGGQRERQAWLETNFPDEYGRKKVEKKERKKSIVDTLWEDAEAEQQ